MRNWLAVAFACVALGQSQPPSPGSAIRNNPQHKPTTDINQQPTNDERGTDKSPISVKVLPAPKTDQETSDAKTQREDQSSANWWMVRLTFAVVLVGVIQTIVFGVQAKRLKQTVEKMEEIATQQTADIQASIAQAARSAEAIEKIATSIAASTESVKDSAVAAKASADAANKNIELMIAKERARLKIRLYPVLLEEQLPETLRWSITNYGDSKAFVDHARSRVFCAPNEVTSPDVSNFKTPNHDLYGLPIKPEDTRTTGAIIAPVLGTTHKDIQSGTITLWFYALVEYHDAFGKYHSRTLRRLQPLPPWANSGIPVWDEDGNEET